MGAIIPVYLPTSKIIKLSVPIINIKRTSGTPHQNHIQSRILSSGIEEPDQVKWRRDRL
ncbi:MAG TPA: hypothetical protein VE643_00845 [Nitrososphaeraceae archaeon]|nr:hypothetical protein [Nitrososphaeraceae archaeon]